MPGLFIIGEKLNSSRRSARRLLENRDRESLIVSAREQISGGAACIDINTSMLMEDEEDALIWAARQLTEELRVAVSLDSPDIELLMRAAPVFGKMSVLNSLTSDKDMIARALPLLAETGAAAVVMLKTGEGIPGTVDERIHLADMVAGMIEVSGIEPQRIYFDPIISPLATSEGGMEVSLETIRLLNREFTDFHRIIGLSNVSYGMPLRRLFNRTFLAMAISCGIDALICDTTDSRLMESLNAATALTGKDPGCRDFLKYYRKKASETKPHS